MSRGSLAVTCGLTLLLGVSSAPAELWAQTSPEDAIRTVRAASNAAIVGRDLGALEETWVDELQVTASSGMVIDGGPEMARLFGESFEDPEFVTYVRAPTTVSISPGGTYAAEAGEWTGSWTREDGEQRIQGTYLAQWQIRDGAWRIRSELYVALSCSGSARCQELP